LKYKNALEKVQKKCLRFLYFRETDHYRYQVPYDELLNLYQMDAISRMRSVSQLIHLYKLLNAQVDDSFYLALNVKFQLLTINLQFYFQSHTAVLLGLNSPINSMMRLYNSVAESVNVFNVSKKVFCGQLAGCDLLDSS